MSLLKKLTNRLRGLYLDIYFYFNQKILYKDKYGLTYYLYKNTRPKDTFNIGVRTDDTTVLYIISKILTSPEIEKKDTINCIDVGSYIGVVTLMMSKSLQNSKKNWKIHSFEPFKDTFLKLQQNINLYSFKHNIMLNNLAVSDTNEMRNLQSYPNAPGQNHLVFGNSADPGNEFNNQEKIQVTTLRDYIIENKIKNISICKIDTEGSDELVIKGLYEFLEKKVIDYFILEYQNDDSFKKIKKILNTQGYNIYYMVRNENILVNSERNYPKNSKSLLNLIAVSPEEEINFKKNLQNSIY